MSTKTFTKQKMKIALVCGVSVAVAAFTFQGCTGGLGNSVSPQAGASSTGGTTGTTGTGTTGTTGAAVVAGFGANQTGSGTVTCPTQLGIVNKIQNALGVSVATGNCAKGYANVQANLPQTSNCTQANGFDSAQLLIYACCSDLTTGTTKSVATTTYKVNLAGSVASNQAALIAAGQTMLNAYTGGLASNASVSTGVTNALTTLLTSATPPATSTIAFMDVCIAAGSAGLLIGN